MTDDKRVPMYIGGSVAFGVLLVLILVLVSTISRGNEASMNATVNARVNEAINETVVAMVNMALTEAGVEATAAAQGANLITQVVSIFPTPTPTRTPFPTGMPLPTPISIQMNDAEFMIGAANYDYEVVAWSGDGGSLVGADDAMNLVIGLLSSGDIRVVGQLNGALTAVDWTSDNRRIAAADDSGQVYLRDTQSAGALTPTGVESPVLALAWSPDNTLLAGLTANKLYIWDITLLVVTTADLRQPIDSGASLSWSPDGTQLGVTTGYSANILTWGEGRFTEEVRTFPDIANPVYIDFAPNENWVAIADGQVVRVFNLENSRQRLELVGHVDTIRHLDWSPNSDYIVSSGNDGTARIWETELGVQEYVLQHNLAVTMGEWSPDGSILATKELGVFLWTLPINTQN